jgi:uncharacterized protein
VSQVAADGRAGQASPFAVALSRALPTPGLEINDMAKLVRREVSNVTVRKQVPTYTDGAFEDFYFVKAVAVVPTVTETEELLWRGALSANTKTGFENYLSRFPNGQFASMARENALRFGGRTIPSRPVFRAVRWGLKEQDFSILSWKELSEKARVASRIAELQRASLNGDQYAMVLLGVANQAGTGTDKDIIEALRLYQLLVEANNPAGMAHRGFTLLYGNGVEPNAAEAVRLFRRSAEAGNAWGMDGLGFALSKGVGTAQNLEEAAQWYQTAAELGRASSMSYFGVVLQDGLGRQKNEAEAARWYRKAAEKGDAFGMNRFAFMLAACRITTKSAMGSYV